MPRTFAARAVSSAPISRGRKQRVDSILCGPHKFWYSHPSVQMPETIKSDELRDFVVENLSRMYRSGGGGAEPDLPRFELTARDYLQFAEQELVGTSVRNRINCVSHLKRAADCQLDTFLHVYNLFSLVKTANLKFDAKLAFLRDIALFSSRSLSRFNEIRNRIEHDYHAPAVTDLEVFYDLVQAFVSVLELASLLLANNAQTDYDIYRAPNDFSVRVGVFTIEYDRNGPTIKTKTDLNHRVRHLSVVPSEREDFAFFFRVFVLLTRRECFRGDQFVLSQLKVGTAK
jgi:hypothetical protein